MIKDFIIEIKKFYDMVYELDLSKVGLEELQGFNKKVLAWYDDERVCNVILIVIV